MKRIGAIVFAVVLFFSNVGIAEAWVCPNCGQHNENVFCENCGTSKSTWVCPTCGKSNSQNYCGTCGTKRPDTNAGIDAIDDDLFNATINASTANTTYNVGDMVIFGNYGGEEIEWRVLEQKSKGTYVLITEKVIDVVPYNQTQSDISWKDSYLRKWLNGIFYQTSFTDDEKNRICITRNKDAKGGSVQDRVYVLSVEEAGKYFTSDEKRVAEASSLAQKNGAGYYANYFGDEYGHACNWWLRDSGGVENMYYGAADVWFNGFIFSVGEGMDADYIGARPVILAALEDSQNIKQAETTHGPKSIASAKEFFVGDTVTFGSYEQDNDSANGKEAIEWFVVDTQGEEVLLLSKYALDCQVYNDSYGKNCNEWGQSSIRSWLNDSFYNMAFTEAEKNVIVMTTTGNELTTTEIKDKVWLITYEDAEAYLMEEQLHCIPTDYAVEQGVMDYGDKDGCFWWFRNAAHQWFWRDGNVFDTFIYSNDGYAGGLVLIGSKTGYLNRTNTSSISENYIGVRPAIWVDLSMLIHADSIVLSNAGLSLAQNEKTKLNAVVYPQNTTDTNVKWTSSDENIACVTEDGVVSAVGSGSCLITATTCDLIHRYADCFVTVR